MKQIYFYNNSEEYIDNNKSEKKYIIIIVVLSFFVIILFPIGYFIGKEISKKRKRAAYELNDDYDYTSSKDNNENSEAIIN